MLGTGTQLDPYQITTIEEFRSMNDADAYYKLMNDIDINDTAYAYNWSSVDVTFKELDGDGHVIRNINQINGDYVIKIRAEIMDYTKIKNIKFINIVTSGTTSFIDCDKAGTYTNTRDIIMENLEISIAGDNLDYLITSSTSDGNVYLYQSSITLSGTIGYIGVYNSATIFTNVMINLDNVTFYGENTRPLIGYTSYSNNRFYRVCLTGSANFDENSGIDSWFDDYYEDIVYSCYVAVSIGTDNKPTSFSNIPAATSFYDLDLMGGALSSKSNLHALTTEQCKDKDYLNSIGFLVV